MQVGKCIMFVAGQNQYASFSSVDLTQPLAVGGVSGVFFSFWFRFTGEDDENLVKIFSMKSTDGYELSVSKTDSTNNLLVELSGPSGFSTMKIVVLSGFMTGEWAHYVLTFTHTANTIAVFKNGVSAQSCIPGLSIEDSTCGASPAFAYPNYVFTTNYIARNQATTALYYAGYIDSFGIFPWVLSAQQITVLSSATTSMVNSSHQLKF
jgi:hypothetical protein